MKANLFYLMISLLFTCNYSTAQMTNGMFGNEWINYSQTYYKFKISEDGIYRLPISHLELSGVDASKLTETNIQIFHNGLEIPLYIKKYNDSIEYVEFYGKKNRSTLDKELNNSEHFNPEYSLITDSSSYFLTWDNNIQGKRYQNTQTNLTNLPQKESFYISEVTTLPNLVWSPGKVYTISGVEMSKSIFEGGEGWGGVPSINQSIDINTPNFISGASNTNVEVRMYSQGFQHNAEFSIDNQIINNTLFYGDTVITNSFNINRNLLQTTTITVKGLAGASDKQSISYVKVKYPRSFDFEGKSYYKFNVSAGSRKFLEIENFNGSNSGVYLFDITNGVRINCFYDNNTRKVLTDLPASSVDRELVLISFDVVDSYKVIGKVEEVKFTNYQDHNGDYTIIAHKNIFEDINGDNPLVEWAAYRSSELNPVLINVQEIFDQFGYGIDLHPQSIRNFSDYIINNWDNPKYVFMVGKAKEYNQIRNSDTYDSQIPSFGQPASDNLLFTKKGELVPRLSVGRLSVNNSDEFRTYMDKIIEMEVATSDNSWRKNVLHLSGGNGISEQNQFASTLNALGTNLESGAFEANIHSFNKESFNQVNTNNDSTLNSEISKGASILTYLGHATENTIDFELNKIERYNNKYKYPLFLSLSCSSGNIFNSTEEISETLVLSADRGVSAYIGFSKPVSLFSATSFSSEFYRLLSNEGVNYTNGDLVRLSMNSLANSGLINELASNYLIYHGDPALKIHVEEIFNIVDTTNANDERTISSVDVEVVNVGEVYNYPNPVASHTKFQLNGEFSGDVSIEIYDLAGRLVKSIGTYNVGENVDLSQLASGVYPYSVFSKDSRGSVVSMSSKLQKI